MSLGVTRRVRLNPQANGTPDYLHSLSLIRFHDSISALQLFFFFFFFFSPVYLPLEVDFLKSLLFLQNRSSATLLLRVIISFLNS